MESNIEYDKDWLQVLCSDSSYNQDRTHWSPIYDWIKTRIGEGVLLDVGCGFGHLLAEFQDRGTTGIDFSMVAINVAKTRCPRTVFILADVEQSNAISVLNYDIICLTEVLEHINDDLKIVAEIPSGREVFISVPQETSTHPQHLRIFYSLTDAIDRYKPYLNILDHEKISQYNFLCIHGIKK